MRRAAVLLAVAATAAAGCGGAAGTPETASQRALEWAPSWVPPQVRRAGDWGQLYVSLGCVGCHSTDGSREAGPTFLGLAGSRRRTTSGRVTRVAVPDLVRAIRRHEPKLRKRPTASEARALAEFINMIGPTTP